MKGLNRKQAKPEKRTDKKARTKHKGKKVALLAAGAILLLCVGGVYLWKTTADAKQEESTVQIKAGTKEELCFAELSAVRGNEISYFLAEEYAEEKTETEDTRMTGGGQGRSGMEGRKDSVSGNDGAAGVNAMQPGEEGEQAAGVSDMQPGTGGEQAAEISVMQSGMEGEQAAGISVAPSGGSGMPSGASLMTGGFPGGMSMAGAGNSGDYTYNDASYKVTEQEETAMVPVGTEITTKLGTVTTFSRLAAGDFVAIVRNKQSGEIERVYIIG